MEQPEWLMEDLLQWKYLTAIAEHQRNKRLEEERRNASNPSG